MGEREDFWLNKYIPDLLSGMRTLEDVRRQREQDTGKSFKMKTLTRHLNRMGYSARQFVKGHQFRPEEPETETDRETKTSKPCVNCIFYQKGLCISTKQTYEGWLDSFDAGVCPLKESKS
ncbi:MAG: hypothetical protein QMD80_04105 [archaeon]|nr:hypothetical protein [archaeon]